MDREGDVSERGTSSLAFAMDRARGALLAASVRCIVFVLSFSPILWGRLQRWDLGTARSSFFQVAMSGMVGRAQLRWSMASGAMRPVVAAQERGFPSP
mmetsp:Transcript_17041/g.51544  ORF Transcript_17041/g.51544 Transcript_17041/m.51544 type:complete len:98 (-) Transcript_17041:907-1200(-)